MDSIAFKDFAFFKKNYFLFNDTISNLSSNQISKYLFVIILIKINYDNQFKINKY
jgi:hypothetical protein